MARELTDWHCPGSWKKPARVTRAGPRRYGECHSCGTRRIMLNTDGTLAEHGKPHYKQGRLL